MKGLVISWFYPPINSSEGLVTFKLLNRSETTHDVFTQHDNSLWSYNTTEHALGNQKIKTIIGNGDSHEAWVRSCLEYFDEHHNEYGFIMSRSMPPESHEAALAIKRKYPNVKWIASFGDPIHNSPYTKIATSGLIFNDNPKRVTDPRYLPWLLKRQFKKQLWHYQSRRDRIGEKKKQTLERNTLIEADSVIFNNQYQQDFMLAQHDIETIAHPLVLPHPYEASMYRQKQVNEIDKKVTLSHIGHLDWIRNPSNLLKAVVRIRDNRPELYHRLDLTFYGTLDNFSKIYIVDHELYETVHSHKPVSYFESLDIMQRSDYCLLIDANISSQYEKNIYFAAKLADYIGSGTPILAISMTDGASADIIRATGNTLSSHSVDEIYMNLVLMLENRVNNSSKANEKRKFDAQNTSKLYDSIIQELMTE